VSLIFFGVLAVAWWISAPPARAGTCPNEALRAGASAHLPDCRAYELVSPSDANGRMLEAVGTLGFKEPFDLFPTELASPSAGSIVYMTFSSPLASPGKAAFPLITATLSSIQLDSALVRRPAALGRKGSAII
jgi:hypothetical protein